MKLGGGYRTCQTIGVSSGIKVKVWLLGVETSWTEEGEWKEDVGRGEGCYLGQL